MSEPQQSQQLSREQINAAMAVIKNVCALTLLNNADNTEMKQALQIIESVCQEHDNLKRESGVQTAQMLSQESAIQELADTIEVMKKADPGCEFIKHHNPGIDYDSSTPPADPEISATGNAHFVNEPQPVNLGDNAGEGT